MEIKRVQMYIYDGTIESYNLMIERLYSDREKFYVGNIDNHYHSTNKWTGMFIVYPTGMAYKHWDSYVVDIDDTILASDTSTTP